ncbi:hypothetical protein Vafri_19469, partial [Volvox africanus]
SAPARRRPVPTPTAPGPEERRRPASPLSPTLPPPTSSSWSSCTHGSSPNSRASASASSARASALRFCRTLPDMSPPPLSSAPAPRHPPLRTRDAPDPAKLSPPSPPLAPSVAPPPLPAPASPAAVSASAAAAARCIAWRSGTCIAR